MNTSGLCYLLFPFSLGFVKNATENNLSTEKKCLVYFLRIDFQSQITGSEAYELFKSF